MLGSKPTPVELPNLESHPPYAEVLARQAKISTELRAVKGERDAVAAALVEEFGNRTGARDSVSAELFQAFGNRASAPTDSDIEAFELAGCPNQEAVRHRDLATRHRALAARAVVLGKALALLDAEALKARKAAQQAFAQVVFRDLYKPAIRDCGEKLLVAAKALRDLVKVQDRIDTADLLVGPMASQYMPVSLLESQLDPAQLVESLVNAGAVTDAEAAELRKKFATA